MNIILAFLSFLIIILVLFAPRKLTDNEKKLLKSDEDHWYLN
jgi:hypothetical protein